MQLGAKLRELRRMRRLTLAEVSQQTQLSVSFLSDVERSRTRPSLETLGKLAQVYKTAINELLDEIPSGVSGVDPIYPPGFKEFLEEVENDANFDKEIVELMPRVEQRAKRRATSKEDWKLFYYSLEAILGR
jgi:XRE family transcriptional regulator, regulator of sulfur utilization